MEKASANGSPLQEEERPAQRPEHPEHTEQVQFSRELGRALSFLVRSRKRFMGEKLKDYEFTGAMYIILLHVDRHPGASQDSIATHMYLDKCSVARRTKKLEELGCLYRVTDQNDRRQNNLYLTEKGRNLAPVIRDYLGQWGTQVSAPLTPEEKETLLALLTKMQRAAAPSSRGRAKQRPTPGGTEG